jgi:serine protease inhibitor
MSIKIKIFLLCLPLLLLWSCTRKFGTDAPVQPSFRDLSSAEKSIVQSGEDFGIQLFKELNSPDENIFISPLSVSMALGMTLNGADGETKSAMQKTLGFENLSEEEINSSYQSLISLLQSMDHKVVFQIANSIWYRLGFSVEPTFIDINQKYFCAAVRGLDFSSAAAPGTINAWASENTAGKIDKIIDSIDPETMMFLINAIYFNGDWTYEFDKDKTRADVFYKSTSDKVSCTLMNQQNEFAYLSRSDLQAIDLPYSNGQFSMLVLLPQPDVSIDDVVQNLSAQSIAGILSDLAKAKGSLYLPKFKMRYDKSLNDVLAKMGMSVAFSPSAADFTRINKEGGLYISDVRHNSYIDVDEQGTEAAAVTVVEVVGTSIGGPSAGFIMRVDRPFLFLIHERHSNTVLFIGKIVNPNL